MAGPGERSITLSNASIERLFSIDGAHFHSVAITNRCSGRTLALDSEEFRLLLTDGRVITGRDCRYRSHEQAELPDGTLVLKVALDCPAPVLQIDLVFSLARDDFWLRKQLSVTCGAQTGCTVDRCDVECFATKARISAALEYQPLYIEEDFFLGLEYPAGVNEAADGRVRLAHFPGAVLTTTAWKSQSAVCGVAVSGNLHRDFLAYIDRIRCKSQPYITWNSGGELQIYAPVQLRKRSLDFAGVIHGIIEELQRELTAKRGVPIHSFTLEPSWHKPDTLYEVDGSKFPGRLRPLAEKIRAGGSGLGLWLSPTPPISPILLRKAAMERLGYATTENPDHPGAYPCLSSEPYFTDIRNRMVEYARDLNVSYYKMDFSFVVCQGNGHGHLPSKRHGREANVNALIRLLESIRAARPDIALVPTSGMWLSPWWLMHATVVWPHGMLDFNYDRGPVSTAPRDWEITLRDQELYRLLRAERGRFPLSGITGMIHMYAGPRYNIGGPLEPRETYLNNVAYGFARHLRGPERFIDAPPSRLPEDWDFTAQAVKWSLDRYGRVPEGEMILGQPTLGEVCGFRYLGPVGGVLCLRNPDMRTQSVVVPVETLDGTAEFVVEVVFPYRRCLAIGRREQIDSALEITLASHEAVIIEITPLKDLVRPLVRGGRYAIIKEEQGKLELDVFRYPGQPLSLEWVSPAPVRSVTIDGKPVQVTTGRHTLAPEEPCEEVAIFRMAAERPADPDDPEGITRTVTRVDIPDRDQATFRVVTDGDSLYPLFICVNNGGVFGGLPYQVCKGRSWNAYDVDLNPRDLNIVRWGFSKALSPRKAAMWLLRRRELIRHRVVITTSPLQGVPARIELPTPFAHVVREAVCISELQCDEGDGSIPWTDEYAEQVDQ